MSALRFERVDRGNGCYQLLFAGKVNGIPIYGRTLTVFPRFERDAAYAARAVTTAGLIHRSDGSCRPLSASVRHTVVDGVRAELEREH